MKNEDIQIVRKKTTTTNFYPTIGQVKNQIEIKNFFLNNSSQTLFKELLRNFLLQQHFDSSFRLDFSTFDATILWNTFSQVSNWTFWILTNESMEHFNFWCNYAMKHFNSSCVKSWKVLSKTWVEMFHLIVASKLKKLSQKNLSRNVLSNRCV